MKKLLSFGTSVEAHLLRGRLETAGIPCEVRGGSYLDQEGGFQEPPSVWIAREEDRALALEIANEPPKASGWPWTCARCRETNESPFDACWSCGTPRGGSSPSAE